jgi:hypothetical protein
MHSALPATWHRKWHMHYIYQALPRGQQPHTGCHIGEWAQPDVSRALRSEISCATSLMMECMLDKDYSEHNIVPVRFFFGIDVSSS